MTRFKETCTLIAKEYSVDSEGVVKDKARTFRAYCNSYTIATQAWATAKMANWEADEEIQLRACDYHGEEDVIYQGKAYTVFQKMPQGDFVRLMLQRRKSDVSEDGGVHEG